MNALSMSGAFAAPRSIAAPGTSTASTPASTGEDAPQGGGGDLLSAMNPAMDAAFAVGRPTSSSGAAAILATTGAYVAGANQTIDKIDADLERRYQQLELLRQSDPEAADKAQQQIDLLERLRDRIQLSIERVTRTASGGGDEDADTFDEDLKRAAAKRRERDAEQLELLERRRELLGGQVAAAIAPTDASMVAGTYGAARAAATGAGGTPGAA